MAINTNQQILKNNREQPRTNRARSDKLRHAKHFVVTFAFFCTVISLFICVPIASASTKVRFKQIIAPLNCLFDEVNDGSGAVVYLTPETCGTMIQPQRTNQSTTSTTAATSTRTQPVPSEYYSGSQYLDSEGGSASSQNGYMLIVHAGLVYNFRLPGDSPVGAPRTLEITSIHNGVVTITFGPGDKQTKLVEEQLVRANIAYDAEADVEVTAVQINSDDSAVLHVNFPVQSRLAGKVTGTNNTTTTLVIFWLLTGAVLYVHAHSRYRSRHTRFVDRNWKVEETIK